MTEYLRDVERLRVEERLKKQQVESAALTGRELVTTHRNWVYGRFLNFLKCNIRLFFGNSKFRCDFLDAITLGHLRTSFFSVDYRRVLVEKF